MTHLQVVERHVPRPHLRVDDAGVRYQLHVEHWRIMHADIGPLEDRSSPVGELARVRFAYAAWCESYEHARRRDREVRAWRERRRRELRVEAASCTAQSIDRHIIDGTVRS